jgi:hypothetical protein
MTKWLVSAFLFIGLWVPAARSQTIMATSCNNTSGNTAVQNAINSATAGQTITIPSGTCAWTIPVTISGIGLTLSCQAGAVIQDDVPNASGPMLVWTGIPESALPRITGCDWEPFSGNSVSQFMNITGTCNSSGCTQFRFDHNLWGAASCWPDSTGGVPYFPMDNVFGVIDHNGTASQPMCKGAGTGGMIFNFELDSYQGVGNYGDNSWAQTDTFGSVNAMYVEDNYFQGNGGKIFVNDCDGHGCRVVARHNTLTLANLSGHGTESPGRARGTRQFEIYQNTFITTQSYCQSSGPYLIMLLRSGAEIGWGNTFKMTGSGACNPTFAGLTTLNTFRSFGGGGSGLWRFWGNCGTCSPWDINDGQQAVITGTITAVNGSTVTDSTKLWITNQFQPTTGGVACLFMDTVVGNSGQPVAGVLSNGTNSVTLGGGYNSGTMHVGDTYWISCAKAYVASTVTTGGSTITDTKANGGSGWTTNQWFVNGAPYTMWDLTLGASNEITSNTATTLTGNSTCNNFSCATYGAGDVYVITRATQCLDQSGAGVLPGNTNVINISGIPILPVGPVKESIDPVYEFMDTLQSTVSWNGAVSSSSARQIANRDFFQESTNQAAQTSPTSPFDGSSGTGHGTFANMPPCTSGCVVGAGYWATDQGSWNHSGSGGQGQFYVWNGTSWGLYYTPYAYPHPLTTGNLPTPPSPPTGLSATVQ